uniref:protein PXR1 n=1 Tax=Erigeron canadensis TaxID=72917 RepID=UPI001CB88B96|nr:protein PXR1 [Erigeron canadensis]
MGETGEEDAANREMEEKNTDNQNGKGDKDAEKAKDKKKKKDKKEKKEKNPEDKNDPTKLKAKLEKIDSKIQALNVRREEILKLIEAAQANASTPGTGANA